MNGKRLECLLKMLFYAIVLLCIFLCFASCRTQKEMQDIRTETHDRRSSASERSEYGRTADTLVIHDSIYLHEHADGSSEKVVYRYRDRTSIVHDTLQVIQIDTLVLDSVRTEIVTETVYVNRLTRFQVAMVMVGITATIALIFLLLLKVRRFLRGKNLLPF